MPNKMLIDATHPEETRVVVNRGKRVEEFDLESQERRQLRGNIYLAKVTRVEPSLQAAFVDYGGNRHGFLAFSEIHPDYYQIPVADRQALLEEVAAAEAEASANEAEQVDDASLAAEDGEDAPGNGEDESEGAGEADAAPDAEAAADEQDPGEEDSGEEEEEAGADAEAGAGRGDAAGERGERRPRRRRRRGSAASATEGPVVREDADAGPVETVDHVGAEDALEEVPRRSDIRRRQYKIQEVIRRRQIVLVQVVKEERGTKGAALTTYLSLAGRYCVLMPNTARGGGISRKITNLTDRRRLKSIAGDLEVPDGTGVIVRTAGANRTKAEIKRDFEYLLRLWETIRELTLKSTAPSVIYEEGSLIKRSIRDLYNKDIDEILVEGEEGYKEAKAFMRMLMPSHARHVKQYKDAQPLFVRHRVESQLDQMFSPNVTLPSGGYLVINQTEALVAIDVNSGKSTREHNIEDTALNTNLEAATEVARQLRLRDLAGLVVIDFIDMEEKRNNRAVERRVKESLKTDRARIQVGRISHFGLLEMSRQRIRASVIEGTMETCPCCQGSSRIRSVSSAALQIVRTLEEQAIAGNRRDLTIRANTAIALYMLNQKRTSITEIENRFGIDITVVIDETLLGSAFAIERGEPSARAEPRASDGAVQIDTVFEEDDPAEEVEDEQVEAEAEQVEERAQAETEDAAPGRRRRRRRGRKRGEDGHAQDGAVASEAAAESEDDEDGEEPRAAGTGDQGGEEAQARPRRRRGRRGGRRQRRDGDDAAAESAQAAPRNGDDADSGVEAAQVAEAAPGKPEPEIAWPWQGASGSAGGDAVHDHDAAGGNGEAVPEPAAQAAANGDAGHDNDEASGESETVPELAVQAAANDDAGTPHESDADVVAAEEQDEAVPGDINGASGSDDDHRESEAAAAADEQPAEPRQPQRRGWWQRRVAAD